MISKMNLYLLRIIYFTENLYNIRIQIKLKWFSKLDFRALVLILILVLIRLWAHSKEHYVLQLVFYTMIGKNQPNLLLKYLINGSQPVA